MSKETRIALLCGLGLIIAFGVVLSELKSTPSEDSSLANETSFSSYALKPASPGILPTSNSIVAPSPPGSAYRADYVPARDLTAVGGVVGSRKYTVKPNDSLSKIAVAQYGSGRADLYKLIYRANSDQLADAETLQVGQVLIIPDTPQTTSGEDERLRALRTGQFDSSSGRVASTTSASGGYQ